jgi:hypothetical protein
MKLLKPRALVFAATIVIFVFILWMVVVLLGYVGDDLTSPPADQRSVPAAKTY